jgi:hypothetical protein
VNHTSYDTLAGDGRLLTRPLLTGWSEHRASTARRPTAASINSLKGGRTAPFDEQSIINEQLFASLDVAQRVEVDATALLLGLAVRDAAMVHPARRVSAAGERFSSDCYAKGRRSAQLSAGAAAVSAPHKILCFGTFEMEFSTAQYRATLCLTLYGLTDFR